MKNYKVNVHYTLCGEKHFTSTTVPARNGFHAMGLVTGKLPRLASVGHVTAIPQTS